jgi:hypothetical protein
MLTWQNAGAESTDGCAAPPHERPTSGRVDQSPAIRGRALLAVGSPRPPELGAGLEEVRTRLCSSRRDADLGRRDRCGLTVLLWQDSRTRSEPCMSSKVPEVKSYRSRVIRRNSYP